MSTELNKAAQEVIDALDARDADRAALFEQPAQQQGWKLVPVEPTAGMIRAAAEQEMQVGDLGRTYSGTYRAMLKAVPQPAQEPVAWMWRCKPYCDWPNWSISLKRPADSGRDGHKRTEGYEDMPLYTSPQPSKPWVGLTDEDDIIGMARDAFAARYCALPVTEGRIKALADAIEAKLREKNT